MHENIIGLKEFRENVDEYAKKINKGKSFIVVKRSRPIFKIVPMHYESDEGTWKTVIDFTKIRKEGVPAEDFLKIARKIKVRRKLNPVKARRTLERSYERK